jgi:hypothetical protein
MVIGEEGRSSSFKFFLIQNLKLLLFPHSRFFASIRGSEILKDSAQRGRIALPGEEVPRRMRGTAGGTPAHHYEEAVSSLSLITNNQ